MPWILSSVLAFIIIIMITKNYLIKKDIQNLTMQIEEKLLGDTNVSLHIFSKDKQVKEIAEKLNIQLDNLRKQQLKYQHGNTELNTAVTNISHDLRTPLTAIYGYLDMMQKTELSEQQIRYISIIKERTEMMKHLTEELFRYSVILSDESYMNTEKVFINQVLAESISSFYPAFSEKGIIPQITITDNRIIRSVNRAALSRVFANLLNNAVKYSDGDLEITLSDTGEIIFSNIAEELSAVEVEQLFDRFYTVETAHHSTGLGLSIARTLVERMGGEIVAEYASDRLIIKICF